MSAQTSENDSRYPHPRWVRFLQSSVMRWLIIPMIIIVVYLLFNLVSILQNGGDLVKNFISSIRNLWISIPILLILMLSILASIFTRRWMKKENQLYVGGDLWKASYEVESDEDKRPSEEVKRQSSENRRKSGERTYDPVSSDFVFRYTLSGHSSLLGCMAWSPNGRMLASGSLDKSIKIWNVQTGQELQTLVGHSESVYSVAWAPDEQMLASGSDDRSIKIWNVQTGQEFQTLRGHSSHVNSIAWSPDGQKLISSSHDSTIKIWDVRRGQELQTLMGHSASVYSVAWSPDGKMLASGSFDSTIKIWDARRSQEFQTLVGHYGRVYSVAWSPDGKMLASGSDDRTIRIWDPFLGNQSRVLERHTDSITSIAFFLNGRLLVSRARDGTMRLWRTDTWEVVTTLRDTTHGLIFDGSMVCPTAPVIATFGDENRVIHIWDFDFDIIFNSFSPTISNSYTNAKVVLLGDSGVGKSGLGLVLSEQLYTVTESTHARRVWTFEQQEAKLSETSKETRETLLWDLAGQPGYRLVHQLHLNEVAVALVVFDAHSETNPFAGVEYWHRALLQAQRVQGNAALPLKKFLVAARIDRAGIGASQERIQEVVYGFGFDGYFATSAREGWQIDELKATIGKAIDWAKMLPKVSSTELFQQIKSFLVEEKKQATRLISTVEDLYRTFVRSEDAPLETEELPAQFETCIGLVEAAGLIKRLSFGRLVLLQPEMLDAYASALVNVVKDEPDGLGHIAEERVRTGYFHMSADERIQDKQQEELLLLAMVEDLLRRELVLREESYLVFPSQSTKENPDLPNPEGKTVVFDFEGPVPNIYATLAVRLANSGVFKKKSLWKNAIIYTAKSGGECGMFLHNIGEGRGDLTVFYPQRPSRDVCNIFEEYVHVHLKRRALPDNFRIRRIIVCHACNTMVSDDVIQRRKERNLGWLNCPVCDTRVSLVEQDEPLRGTPSPGVQRMDQAADAQRDIQVNKTSVEGKKELQDFDVFLCHHGIDKPAVKKIGEQLQERGLLPWLDEWELRPGLPWQRILEEQIGQIKCAAVFVGKNGIGPWQQLELEGFLREFADRGSPVIPVLLEDAPTEPVLPRFLKGMTWVDFRKKDPDPMEQLKWGITGKRKGR